jgi:Bacterial Ig domain
VTSKMRTATQRLLNIQYIVFLIAASCTAYALVRMPNVDAACAALPEPYGKVTISNIEIKSGQEGTYRIWTRMMAPDSSNNSYYLQIDDSTCALVVGDKAKTGSDNGLAANQWGWVNYRNTTPTATPTYAPIDVSLGVGLHTFYAVGKEEGVKIDRIILTQSTTCIPDNLRDTTTGHEPGDNCVPRDVSAPVVNISAPSTSPFTLSGTSTTVQVTVTDDISGIKAGSVKLCIINPGLTTCPASLISPDSSANSSPFSFTINTSTWAPGDYTIRAFASDNASPANTAWSTDKILRKPDTSAPTASIVDPTPNEVISGGTTTFTANATDNVGIKTVNYRINGSSVLVVNLTAPYPTTYAVPSTVSIAGRANGIYQASVIVTDSSNNTVTSANVPFEIRNTVTINNPPTALIVSPTGTPKMTISDTFTVRCNASDSGTIFNQISKVEFFYDGTTTVRSTDTDGTDGYTYALDTKTLSNGDHTFYCKAYDNSATPLSGTSVGVVAAVNNVTFAVGDINRNGCVGLRDLSILNGNPMGDFDAPRPIKTTAPQLGRTDLNGSGNVDLRDFSVLNGGLIRATCDEFALP